MCQRERLTAILNEREVRQKFKQRTPIFYGEQFRIANYQFLYRMKSFKTQILTVGYFLSDNYMEIVSTYNFRRKITTYV